MRLFRGVQIYYYLLWIQWLLIVVTSASDTVICVMDETMVPFQFKSRKTNVVALADEHKDAITQNADPAATKTSMSLIGTICNRADLQPHLPQILLPKGKKNSDSGSVASSWGRNMPEPPAPVQVWKEFSGWMTGASMKKYLQTLKAAIHSKAPGLTIVLVVDAAPAHMTMDVLRYAARSFGYCVIVPGNLGWLLDILDSKVYGPYKQYLFNEIVKKKVASAGGTMAKPEWARVVYESIDAFFARKTYVEEFPRHGLSTDLSVLRPHIQMRLGNTVMERPRKLTQDELNVVLGMKRDIHRLLFQGRRFDHLDELGRLRSPSSSSSSAAVRPIARASRLAPLARVRAGVGRP